MGTAGHRFAVALVGGVVGAGVASTRAAAQGCEPIRFMTPVSLGAGGEAYQPDGQWRVTVAYRKLRSDQWFIGSEESGDLAPGGSPPVFDIHTFVGDVSYAFNDRFSARVSIPYSTGSFSRIWADGAEHEQTASGIGDISLQGEAWVLNPRTHQRGNFAVGLGIKTSTGSHTRPSQFYLPTGPVDFPADQNIQPGDGGWGILMHLRGFQRVGERFSVYGLASYMASPKAQTSVRQSPAPSALNWSVPDVYSARAGAAFEALSSLGMSVSLGGRIDGIPTRDLFGGGDENTVKRTSYIMYADPGLSLTSGPNNVTLSVPWRLHVNRTKSLAEQQPGATPNAGGFAKYLIFASYSRRF